MQPYKSVKLIRLVKESADVVSTVLDLVSKSSRAKDSSVVDTAEERFSSFDCFAHLSLTPLRTNIAHNLDHEKNNWQLRLQLLQE